MKFSSCAVALHLALYPAHRLREEVLGLLQVLILRRCWSSAFLHSLVSPRPSRSCWSFQPGPGFYFTLSPSKLTLVFTFLPYFGPNYSKNRNH